MNTTAITKPVQYALLAWIAKRQSDKGHRLGKKALQKTVHLIQELGGVDTGYKFSFYTYGPYSSELAGDLDVVAALGGVSVTYNGTDNYYLIKPSPESDNLVKKGETFIEGNKKPIEKVMESFGGRLAKELELVSTVAYLRRHMPKREFENNQALSEQVKELKPKYSYEEVSKAIDEVKRFLAA